jgi:hypothetical protein
MFHVLRPARRARTRALFVAAFMALTAQVVATAVAPLAEARDAQAPAAHVESGGTHQHKQITHNPDTCPACIALQLTPLPQRPAAARALIPARYAPRPVASSLVPAARSRFAPKTPRAPPAFRASVA